MNLALGPKTRFRAMLALWVYDVVKIALICKVLQTFGINPWIFFFLDMVTVPAYINGWTRLITSLTGKIPSFAAIFRLGTVTFFASTGPYLYAAWAGRQSFPAQVWLILMLILLFPLINLIRKIHTARKKVIVRQGNLGHDG